MIIQTYLIHDLRTTLFENTEGLDIDCTINN